MATTESDDEVPAAIGRHVREARIAQGMTLDQLAAASGVSRRMIVNVESGTTNASITTLLRLTGPLQTTLGALVEGAAPSTPLAVSSAQQRQPLWRGKHGGTATLVTSADTPDMLEMWEWLLEPGESYDSEAHRVGTFELFHVQSGQLTLTLGDAVAVLRAGDATSLAAHVPHTYANRSRRPTRFSMTVLEPTRRVRP